MQRIVPNNYKVFVQVNYYQQHIARLLIYKKSWTLNQDVNKAAHPKAQLQIHQIRCYFKRVLKKQSNHRFGCFTWISKMICIISERIDSEKIKFRFDHNFSRTFESIKIDSARLFLPDSIKHSFPVFTLIYAPHSSFQIMAEFHVI